MDSSSGVRDDYLLQNVDMPEFTSLQFGRLQYQLKYLTKLLNSSRLFYPT